MLDGDIKTVFENAHSVTLFVNIGHMDSDHAQEDASEDLRQNQLGLAARIT